MTGVKQHFTILTETRLDLEVVLGDNTLVMAVGRETISFLRECGESMKLRDVLYILGLKKNLLSVFTIDDRGFWVMF